MRKIFVIGETLRQGFCDILTELNITAQVLGDGPLCALSFTNGTIIDYRSAFRANGTKRMSILLKFTTLLLGY